MSFVTLYRIEAGRLSCTVTMLEKLGGLLEISVRDFFPVERSKRGGRS